MEFNLAQVAFSLSCERTVIYSCLDCAAPKASFPVKGLPLGAYAPLTGETGILVSSPESRKVRPPNNGIYSYTYLIFVYKILDTISIILINFISIFGIWLPAGIVES